MPKKIILFILFLTCFSFLIRLYRFNQPSRYYFDEVYHAVTAGAYAQNNKDAYNPFAKAPKEGTAYDWLHPPLAKLIQAGSIKVFGDNPVGWRIPSLIFGTLLVPATFILAYILFGLPAAVFSSIVIAFENLAFVMSRITMNDIFVTLFIICSFIFAYRYLLRKKFTDLVITGIFLGLSLATKWTGLYAILIIFLFLGWDQFKNRKVNLKLPILFIIPVIIYFSSYAQYFLLGYKISDFINLHKQIWWYQNREDLEHSYGTTPLFCVPKGLNEQKTWCPWLLNIRGVYFSYEQYGEKAGYIYALGNPMVLWMGVIGISYLLGKFIEEKNKEYGLILLGYFIFWVPWIFSPRIMFLYHYLPSIPFLSIALGYSISQIYTGKLKIVAVGLILIIIAGFFYFYPISSGLPIKISDIDKFMWLKTWR